MELKKESENKTVPVVKNVVELEGKINLEDEHKNTLCELSKRDGEEECCHTDVKIVHQERTHSHSKKYFIDAINQEIPAKISEVQEINPKELQYDVPRRVDKFCMISSTTAAVKSVENSAGTESSSRTISSDIKDIEKSVETSVSDGSVSMTISSSASAIAKSLASSTAAESVSASTAAVLKSAVSFVANECISKTMSSSTTAFAKSSGTSVGSESISRIVSSGTKTMAKSIETSIASGSVCTTMSSGTAVVAKSLDTSVASESISRIMPLRETTVANSVVTSVTGDTVDRVMSSRTKTVAKSVQTYAASKSVSRTINASHGILIQDIPLGSQMDALSSDVQMETSQLRPTERTSDSIACLEADFPSDQNASNFVSKNELSKLS
ncbi:hypothetical protein X975_19635, partial [Stegodyphus mimosarum]